MGGRRTSGWRRPGSDANQAARGSLASLRNTARDLTRNNPWAANAVETIVDQAVGWGIVAAPNTRDLTQKRRVMSLWQAWAETRACDADGRCDFAGLQKLVMRTVVESGEVLIRRRPRRPDDGLTIPLQLQVLEPDYLDESRDGTIEGARVIQGVEFDAIGRRTAYYLYRDHPGALRGGYQTSERVPASDLLHVWRPRRPGQVRGVPWLAPVELRLRDLDDYEDAALMKQKVAACLAVITTDPDGTAPPLGEASAPPGPTGLETDTLQPGAILNVAPGRQVTVVDPPRVSEHEAYARTVLRAIAAGIGITYEDLTGDYTGMPFSAARMSWLRHWMRVEDWRWRMLIPQFCDPVWQWFLEVAAIVDPAIDLDVRAIWTAPPMPMVDPAAEARAYITAIRGGLMSWSEVLRSLGYDPQTHFAELAADKQVLDALGLILDSDPSRTTQAGQLQGDAVPAAAAAASGSTNGRAR